MNVKAAGLEPTGRAQRQVLEEEAAGEESPETAAANEDASGGGDGRPVRADRRTGFEVVGSRGHTQPCYCCADAVEDTTGEDEPFQRLKGVLAET